MPTLDTLIFDFIRQIQALNQAVYETYLYHIRQKGAQIRADASQTWGTVRRLLLEARSVKDPAVINAAHLVAGACERQASFSLLPSHRKRWNAIAEAIKTICTNIENDLSIEGQLDDLKTYIKGLMTEDDSFATILFRVGQELDPLAISLASSATHAFTEAEAEEMSGALMEMETLKE